MQTLTVAYIWNRFNWHCQLCRHEEVDLPLQPWRGERTHCKGTLPTHGTKSFAKLGGDTWPLVTITMTSMTMMEQWQKPFWNTMRLNSLDILTNWFIINILHNPRAPPTTRLSIDDDTDRCWLWQFWRWWSFKVFYLATSTGLSIDSRDSPKVVALMQATNITMWS